MDSSVANASFYADFAGLNALKKNVKANDAQAIRQAAQQFESLFTDMMLKAMRAAKLGDGLGDSEQGDVYQDMYDQQLAVQMSQGHGLGLADMLVQQLTRSGALHGASAGATGSPVAAGANGGSSSASRLRSTGSQSVQGASGAAGAAASGATPATHRQRLSFVQRLAPYAQQAAAALGVSADSLIAQAALETGWGRHLPGAGSGTSNNLFGIKAGGAWSGQAVKATTTEYSQGTSSQLSQAFRAYSSVQQGVNDYVTVLRRSPGLQAALGTGENVSAFASALQQGGYATDPDYARKLIATAESVRQLRAGAALKATDGVPISAGGDSA